MRDYDKYKIRTKYVFKEDDINNVKVKIRQRFDEYGGHFYRVETKSLIKNEGVKPTAVVVECSYQEDSENWIDYMGKVQHSPHVIRSLIQIRLLNSKGKTCRTFQIYGTPSSFRGQGIIRITNTGRVTDIDETNWEFAEILRFIQYNFDEFTKNWVNLNLKASKTEGITSTPSLLIDMMSQAKEERNFERDEEYFYT